MKELTIAATVENIETVTDFVNEQLEALAKDGTIKALGDKYPKVANSIITDFSSQK